MLCRGCSLNLKCNVKSFHGSPLHRGTWKLRRSWIVVQVHPLAAKESSRHVCIDGWPKFKLKFWSSIPAQNGVKCSEWVTACNELVFAVRWAVEATRSCSYSSRNLEASRTAILGAGTRLNSARGNPNHKRIFLRSPDVRAVWSGGDKVKLPGGVFSKNLHLLVLIPFSARSGAACN